MMTWPVMYDEESDARKYTHSAISSAFPSLPSAMVSASESRVSCPRTFTISVSMTPGATQLTLIPLGASSAARDLVRPITACFVED